MKNVKKLKKLTLLETAHEMAKGLYKANVIDATTMREFDTLCLTPVKELSATEIKKLRLREKVSQPVFAKCLNISTSTVKQWEQGEKHPRGTSLKLLNLVAEKGLSILIA
ncbi:MAG: transcriptional regulator [Gammaproteobacteria bacterium RIFCSPHIGHO2_12_FULL_37_14]|nr:MAG: transcriptional regulator [Gammaproteobacteria bacterium RIFCSPHIGHO2_12_FULL_37_14]